jgi:uncharacterized protein
MEIVGRVKEIALLNTLLKSDESEFLALYGRRRIGKTHLIRQVFKEQIVFECSGLHQKVFSQQLENFWLMLMEYSQNKTPVPQPKTWLQAFAQLKSYLNGLGEGKKVVFLDEIAWFETPRSGFLAALDNFWNQFCTKRDDVILVICGSAASWIINKVVNDRGGLHNRITKHVQLAPFTLAETKTFLEAKRIKLTLKDITQLYMCVGGVPFYLKDLKAGQSIPQILDDLFFNKQATLKNEFANLYNALFKNGTAHETVVKALASKNKGLTRKEIIEITGMNSGGGLTTLLEELVQCNFVMPIYPINKTSEDCLYRLIDEFTLFYFKFLFNDKTKNSWSQLAAQPTYKIWSGYAFENICFKHIDQIKFKLGISGVITNEYSWVSKGTKNEVGSQIDLVIDRNDNCINVLELKFHDEVFDISKQYSAQLREKMSIFKQKTNTKKNVFLTLITAYGVKKNEYFLNVVTNDFLIDDLFFDI